MRAGWRAIVSERARARGVEWKQLDINKQLVNNVQRRVDEIVPKKVMFV